MVNAMTRKQITASGITPFVCGNLPLLSSSQSSNLLWVMLTFFWIHSLLWGVKIQHHLGRCTSALSGMWCWKGTGMIPWSVRFWLNIYFTFFLFFRLTLHHASFFLFLLSFTKSWRTFFFASLLDSLSLFFLLTFCALFALLAFSLPFSLFRMPMFPWLFIMSQWKKTTPNEKFPENFQIQIICGGRIRKKKINERAPGRDKQGFWRRRPWRKVWKSAIRLAGAKQSNAQKIVTSWSKIETIKGKAPRQTHCIFNWF